MDFISEVPVQPDVLGCNAAGNNRFGPLSLTLSGAARHGHRLLAGIDHRLAGPCTLPAAVEYKLVRLRPPGTRPRLDQKKMIIISCARRSWEHKSIPGSR